MGLVKEQDLVAALAKQIGLGFVDLVRLPRSTRRPRRCCPSRSPAGTAPCPSATRTSKLLVAMADPANLFALDDIRTITGMEVQPVVATAADIEAAIRKHSRFDESVEDVASEASLAAEDDVLELERLASRRRGGPDRQDGQPADHARPSATAPRTSTSSRPSATSGSGTAWTACSTRSCARRRTSRPALISRLKVMADLNIAERRVPQDGRVGLQVGGKHDRPPGRDPADGLRREGRHPDPGQELRPAQAGGPRVPARRRSSATRRRTRKPYGAILVTGPTGSGKSTTLYATLNISQQAGPEHHHRRGPGRVPAARHQPDAGEQPRPG